MSVAIPAANGLSIYQAAYQLHGMTSLYQFYWISSSAWPSGDKSFWTTIYDQPWVNLALGPDPHNPENSVVFAIKQRELGLYQLEHSLTSKVPVRITRLDNQTNLANLAVSTNPQGLLEIFAITTDGYLFYMRQNPELASGWDDGFVVVHDPTIAQISVVRDRDGISHVIAVTTGNNPQLYHIWQNPQTTDWQKEQVQIQVGEVEQFESYYAQIVVLDSAGAPKPNASLQIFSDDPVLVEINGAAVTIEAGVPWEASANAAGEVAVSIAADQLGAPSLKLRTGFMPETDRIELDPAGAIQDRLRRIQKEGLLDAKVTADDGSQTPLLQGGNRDSDVVGALMNASNAAMSLLTKKQSAAGTDSLHPRTRPHVARYVIDHDGSNPNHIHPPSVTEQYWRIDFTSGKPVFGSLTREDAELLLASRHATLQGIPTIFNVDWGDIWETIKEGVARVVTDIKDIVVATVVDPVTRLVSEIRAQITVLIEGASYLWEGTLDFVQQAFDIVESVFTKIQVGFEQLYRWLGSIFVWSDILRTKVAIRHCLDQSFDLLGAMVRYVQTNSDNFFTTIQAQVDTAFDELIQNDLGGQSFLALQQAGEAQKPVTLDDSMDGNIVLSAFMNNATTSPPPNTAHAQVLTEAASDAVNAVDTDQERNRR